MQTMTHQRKEIGNLENTVVEAKADQPSRINTDYSWLQYAKVNLALATTLMGMMFLKTTAASFSTLWSSDSAATDTADSVFNNSQQLMPVIDENAVTFAEQPLPVKHRHAKRAGFGGEFQINTYTANTQNLPSIVGLTTGDFVVVWQSDVQDGFNYGIYGQRYSNIGIPQGSEFQINTYTVNYQHYPAVTALSMGGFVVVWRSDGQDGSGHGVYGQRFSSTGVPQGSEFKINTYFTLDQRTPSVAALSTGDFVVTWSSDGQDGSSFGIFGQRFSSTGIPQGSEFQINTYNTNSLVNLQT